MSADHPPVSSTPGKQSFRRGHLDTKQTSVAWRGRAKAWTARAWVEIAVGAVLVIVLLIFILQNTGSTEIAFLPWSFTMPLGVALLFAIVGGVLVMASAGGARIWQLRHQRAGAGEKSTRATE
ncbi:lipopolysaccharide assembly protein LapA domain-containing protein [Nocardia sp. NPDC051756]|uniref:LapA family protein n=1 Tax=Nocardia sp. NPDC051756 TaxID=3154751 RepID=UPI003437C63C